MKNTVSKRIYSLIKIFDREEYARRFLNTGEMYCGTLEKFKKMDDGDGRGDKFEGASQWLQPEDAKISLTFWKQNGEILHSRNIGESDLAGPVVSQPSIFDGFNVFCMYSVAFEDFEETYSTEDEKKILKKAINSSISERIEMDVRCHNLGAYAVVIYRVERFIETVRAYSECRNIKTHQALVEYFDEDAFTGSFNGVDAIFRKRKKYRYQNEFRFAFNASNRTGGAIKLSVGPLNEFAFMGRLRDVFPRLKIEF